MVNHSMANWVLFWKWKRIWCLLAMLARQCLYSHELLIVSFLFWKICVKAAIWSEFIVSHKKWEFKFHQLYYKKIFVYLSFLALIFQSSPNLFSVHAHLKITCQNDLFSFATPTCLHPTSVVIRLCIGVWTSPTSEPSTLQIIQRIL